MRETQARLTYRVVERVHLVAEQEVAELDRYETGRDHAAETPEEPPTCGGVQDGEGVEHDEDGNDDPRERVGGRMDLVWPEIGESGPEEKAENEEEGRRKLEDRRQISMYRVSNKLRTSRYWW